MAKKFIIAKDLTITKTGSELYEKVQNDKKVQNEKIPVSIMNFFDHSEHFCHSELFHTK